MDWFGAAPAAAQLGRGKRIAATGGAVRPLRALLVASIVVPILFFAIAAIISYRSHVIQAEARLRRTTDVAYEHGVKVFETHRLVIDRVNDVIGAMDDAAIAADEKALHDRFGEMIDGLPQIQDIYVFDRNGRALVSVRSYPMPASTDFSDREYFAVQRDAPAGLFVSSLLRGRIDGTVFFNVSARRPSADGSFRGVTLVTVQLNYFERFYGRVTAEETGRAAEGMAIGMMRSKGDILVRQPELREPGGEAPPELLAKIAAEPAQGVIQVSGMGDSVERIVAYKRLEGNSVYVFASLPLTAVRDAWFVTMGGHLIFGVPATIGLIFITFIALRRTQREQAALRIAAEETEQRRGIEEAMRQAQKLEALGQLTGGVAHDFQNLLTVIAGNAEMARGAPPERVSRSLDAILRAARRGETLTRQLLAFARRQTLAPEVIDLHARLPRLAEMLSRSLSGTIEISTAADHDLWLVEVDPGEMELALLNLAVNARDAMPGGGTLTITARNERLSEGRFSGGPVGDCVALAVCDTGHGMSPDVISRAFEPFFTTKDIGKGTGLGLSQVYGFARQAGGTAIIESREEGGTTVTLHLPRSLKPLSAGDGEAEGAAESSLAARAVLLVEADDEVRAVAEFMLERMGCAVTHVARPRRALDLLATERFALVISDIRLPDGMSGIDFTREVRARLPNLPVLLTSAFSEAGPAAGGEFEILAKPFSFLALEAAVRRLLDKGRGLRVIVDHEQHAPGVEE